MINVNDKVTTKKSHPCGNNIWTVVRTGADVKIKCDNCGRIVMLSVDAFNKSVKSINGVKK
ncbi:MAG: DUF951 domain-containing protein [Clostridia bacterium]|nr:DUF951 domain-containing protein [Clostridia bacterium]